MRIRYKIFWVEDDDSWFETRSELFRDTLSEWGFELDCERGKSPKDVEAFIQKNGLQDFDILLVDLQLDNNTGDGGNDVIKLIRNNEIYTDIIFYSSAYDRIQELIKTELLEGVYISDRKNLETKFEKVAKTTIRKIQDVNTIRGLLMAETCDLDDLMLEIILKALKNDKDSVLEKYAIKKMKRTISDNQKRLESGKNTIIEKIKNVHIFTPFHKALVINKICSLNNLNIDKFFDNYFHNVIKTRNIFAHVKEENRGGKSVLVSNISGKEEIFDEERCIDIRKKLIEYRSILEDISSRINKEIN